MMGSVPALRFPEFSGEWREVKLGDCGILLNGLTYSPKDVATTGLLVLRSSNIQENKLSFNDNVYVDISVSEDILTREGDILICVRNGSKRLIGKNTIIPKHIPRATHGAFMTLFRGKSNKFLIHWFQSSKFFRQVHKNLGATINSINGKDLKKFKLTIPPSLPEQQKIADFLSAVDEKMAILTDKITRLEAYKKGMMRKLLSGELRFPGFSGEWREVKVKDIFQVTRGQVLSKDKMKDSKENDYIYPVYSSQTKNDGLIGYYNDYLFEDAITWTTDGANAGFVRYRKDKFYCTNVSGVLLSNKGFANNCIASILNLITKKYVSYVGNPKLMNNVMSQITIKIPSTISEQQKIADFLTAIDDKLTLEKERLEALKRYKQGLLQKMFV